MAWNQPGGSNGKDPWGQRGNQGPPDLDEIVKKIQQKLGGLFGGKGGGGGGGDSGGDKISGMGVMLVLIVVLAVWLLWPFYIVKEGERGVVLRFGKYSETTGPGMRWHLPYPFESAEVVDIKNVSTLEIGYHSSRDSKAKTHVPNEALMLTKDENIIDVEFAIQYRINDAANYLFKVYEQELTIRQASESAIREVAGKHAFDYLITEGRNDINKKISELLQSILDRYEAGIEIVSVDMQDAQPPQQVKDAYYDAINAREEQEQFKNEAQAYANKVGPLASGDAKIMTEQAEGYKASKIARSQGDAQRFNQIALEYARAPRVTRERLYLEAMEEVLSNTTKIYVDQKAGNNLLYLPLDKLVPMRQEQSTSIENSRTEVEIPEAVTDPRRSLRRPTGDDGRSRRLP